MFKDFLGDCVNPGIKRFVKLGASGIVLKKP